MATEREESEAEDGDGAFDEQAAFEEGYDRAVKEIVSHLRDLSMSDAARAVWTKFAPPEKPR